MKTLVYLEIKDKMIKPTSFEALSLAQKMTLKNADDIAALLIGTKEMLESVFPSLEAWGLKTVYTAESEQYENYHVEAHTHAVCQAMEQFDAELLIAMASPLGRDFLPRAAARMNAGILSDLVSVETEAGELKRMVKPMYAGKVLAEVAFNEKAKRKILSLRTKAFTSDNQMTARSPEKISLSLADISSHPLKNLEVRASKQEALDLSEADMIISGGRALGSEEKFRLIHDSAAQIGGTPGASRAAVDSGYASHDMQVGQTGKTVNPKLYIACGISGSIQHMAGMRTSKVIVAINTDPEAPIFSVADYGIVADLFTALPLLSKKVAKLQSES